MFIENFYRNDEKYIFHFEKFNIYESQKDVVINSEVYSEDQLDEIIQKSHEIFDILEKNEDDEQSYMEMYKFLIQYNPIIPQPNENVQSLILHHTIDIQTLELASLAIEYVSYHAKQVPSIEHFIFENIDKKLLHQYFKGEIFNENIFHYLNHLLKFTPNTVNFCIENLFYSDLTDDHKYVDDSMPNDLTFNILLIRTALISFPKNLNTIGYDHFYHYLISKIQTAFQLQIRGTDIMLPLCFSIALCLYKMPNEMTQKCIQKLFQDSNFDTLYGLLEYQISDDDKNVEYCVQINECIALLVYLACGFVPNEMIKRQAYKSISKLILNLSNYQGQYSNDINCIISHLIDGIIFCLETNNSIWRNLFEEQIEPAPNKTTFASMMFSLFDGSYVLKNMSARFFIATLNIDECQPYLVRNQVIQRLIDYFDESNSKDLRFLLRKLNEISDKIMATENYQQNPLFECIQTAECYDSLKHIFIENEEEEFRDNASELLKKIFGESNDE